MLFKPPVHQGLQGLPSINVDVPQQQNNQNNESNVTYNGPLFLRQHSSKATKDSNSNVQEINTAQKVPAPNKLLDLLISKRNASKKNAKFKSFSEASPTATKKTLSSNPVDNSRGKETIYSILNHDLKSDGKNLQLNKRIADNELESEPRKGLKTAETNISSDKKSQKDIVETQKNLKNEAIEEGEDDNVTILDVTHLEKETERNAMDTDNTTTVTSIENNVDAKEAGIKKIQISSLIEPREASKSLNEIEDESYKENDKEVQNNTNDNLSQQEIAEINAMEEKSLLKHKIPDKNIKPLPSSTINVQEGSIMHITNELTSSSASSPSESKEESDENYSSSEIDGMNSSNNQKFNMENLLAGLVNVETRLQNESEYEAESAFKKYDYEISKRMNKLEFDHSFFNREKLSNLINSGVFTHNAIDSDVYVSSTNNISSFRNYQHSRAFLFQNEKKKSRLKYLPQAEAAFLDSKKGHSEVVCDNTVSNFPRENIIEPKIDLTLQDDFNAGKVRWISEWKRHLKYFHIYFENSDTQVQDSIVIIFEAIKLIFEKELGSIIDRNYSDDTDVIILNCDLENIPEGKRSPALKSAMFKNSTRTARKVRIWTFSKILKFLLTMRVDISKYIYDVKNVRLSNMSRSEIPTTASTKVSPENDPIKQTVEGIYTSSGSPTNVIANDGADRVEKLTANDGADRVESLIEEEIQGSTVHSKNSTTSEIDKPNEVPNAAPNEVPNAAPNEVPNAAPNEVPNAAPNEVPNAVTNAVPNEVPFNRNCYHQKVIDIINNSSQLSETDINNSSQLLESLGKNIPANIEESTNPEKPTDTNLEILFLRSLLEKSLLLLDSKTKLLVESYSKIESLSAEVLKSQFTISSLKANLQKLEDLADDDNSRSI
ncbi:hypothetical protein TPHA_0C02030 [Tetrapisispora phaffii CBS 4417]|uniref:Sir4 SID domain-containing protein n=1 Tax=Tetrapisispora phaffii (strain ATCC 24235 / CBS 4417 / NBRC 1672 / NRRL Y-8282 / UCD 70-5) TaxID=1071381 RepID=G8BRI2_TETPH|nr:hypothetical protein TPHA_0C02030 [Tetrapisispora phaffii CBS 4417]CCE62358.1 hypothetical protein TPHA_0C02030 [Tetrapisispora phaffii CBS 4417]